MKPQIETAHCLPVLTVMLLITFAFAGCLTNATAPRLSDAGRPTGRGSADRSSTQAKAPSKSDADERDIIETANQVGGFDTLLAALQTADLLDTLQGSGPFTVFAPTDEAFAKLPDGTVQNLLRPENKQALIELLETHVIPQRIPAAELAALPSVIALSGRETVLHSDGKVLQVGDANITAAGVVCSNGLIHVIDRVLPSN